MTRPSIPGRTFTIGSRYRVGGFTFLMTRHGLEPEPEPISQHKRSRITARFSRLSETMTSEAEAHLASLPYRDFLETTYWKTVRDFVELERGGQCESCNSWYNLHVHHRTYEHRGSEWRFLNDLELLCNTCHREQHFHINGDFFSGSPSGKNWSDQ